ncbi:MAG: putative methyltransferase YcgJ [Candidatus Heimdallarchaeota archaeon LC_3]|nr:MAG: putative methyltransferase YcgJ [Candidatus Heimdallarchaeota archaeon LC_3]
MISEPEAAQQNVQEKSKKILTDIAGYVSVRTINIGLELDLFSEIAKHTDGISVQELAKITGLDPVYLEVWMKSAYGSELMESNGMNTFKLAPFVDKLLLDRDFSGYIGGLPKVMMQPEMFGNFSSNMKSGNRTWWDKTSNEWIKSVIETTRPMYTRMLKVGNEKIPGLEEKLKNGAHVLELASGAGDGITRTAQKYVNCTFVGVDCDDYSIELAKESTSKLNLSNRIKYQKCMFEDINDHFNDEFDIVTINASIHEARDLEKVISSVYKTLKTDGYFVISDFPFPDDLEGLKTVPARIMSGIQFFESQIDDLLLPTQIYVELMKKHGFKDIISFDLTPTHMVVNGRK